MPERRPFRPATVVDAATTGIAVALPLLPALVPALIAVLLGGALWARFAGERGPGRRLDWRSPLFWAALLYLLHVLGLLWTTNMDFAGLDLGIKASLLLFAFLALLGSPPVHVGRAIDAYVGANVLAVLLCLARAMFRAVRYLVVTLPDGEVTGFSLSVPFFSSGFAAFHHPSYMAMYLTLALFLLAGRTTCRRLRSRQRVVVAAVLLMGILLCASKAGWAVLLIAAIAVLLLHRRDARLRRTVTWGLGATLLAGATLIATNGLMRERVVQVLDVLRGEGGGTANSTSDRRMVWDAAARLIAARPWAGVGTGDVKDELLRAYADLGYVDPLEKRLNAHDQYLNTGVALGIPGLMLVVLLVLVPLVPGLRNGDTTLTAFLALNALNWTVESMLEVQAGVVFLAFFSWLFVHAPHRPLPAGTQHTTHPGP
ncbi:MAG: O-antigen ligase family protein [Flavobacteriales bacterium]|nr:hypothetical protein [Flavobacteriales bacterium]MCC6576207.1 O-antigen ligase family protein [Flavobacteriales bacterium]NUQ14973.1 O-antigen ligase family protein [Flavobacteriales bacterium]